MSSSSSPNNFVDGLKVRMSEWERDMQLDQISYLNLAHEKTKQPRIYILIGVVTILFLIVVQLFGLSFVSNIFGFVPIYASFKALRTPEKSDDEYWLTYWVVYGCLSLIESAIDQVFFWLPFYFLFKIAFLIWAYHPQTKGARIIYKKFIGPLFLGLEREAEEIEKSIKNSKQVQ